MNKRYKLFAVICGAVLVAGCTKISGSKMREDVLAAVAAPFSFTGTVTMEGISQPVKLKATKASGELTVELIEPEAVGGLVLEFGEEGVITTFRGLVMNLSQRDIPQQSIFIALRDMLSTVSEDVVEITEKDGLITVKGSAGMLPYTQIWSAGDMVLHRVKLPSVGGTIEIDNFIKMT